MKKVLVEPEDVWERLNAYSHCIGDAVLVAENTDTGVSVYAEDEGGCLSITISEDNAIILYSQYDNRFSFEDGLFDAINKFVYGSVEDKSHTDKVLSDEIKKFDKEIERREEELTDIVIDFLSGITNEYWDDIVNDQIINELLEHVSALGYDIYRPVWVEDEDGGAIPVEYPYSG